jgi:hypothetical protein
MSGMEPLVIGAMVGSTAMSAGGRIMAGSERASAANFEAAQMGVKRQQALIRARQLEGHRGTLEGEQDAFEAQAENTRTAAAQAEAARRDELVSTMDTIEAIRAGRNVGEGGPTGRAMLNELMRVASRDIRTEQFNFRTKADAASRAAHNVGVEIANTDLEIKNQRLSADLYGHGQQYARRRARTSLIAGLMGGAESVFSGIARMGGGRA